MIIAVIVLAVLLAAVVGTLIPMLYATRKALARVGAAPELADALARERRRGDIAEAELKVVRNHISQLESQRELPESS